MSLPEFRESLRLISKSHKANHRYDMGALVIRVILCHFFCSLLISYRVHLTTGLYHKVLVTVWVASQIQASRIAGCNK